MFTDISTGQSIMERCDHTLKKMLIEQEGNIGSPRDKLHDGLLIIKFLMSMKQTT